MTDGRVVVPEQHLHLVRLLNEADALCGKVAAPSFFIGDVGQLLIVVDGQLLILRTRGVVCVRKRLIGLQSLQILGISRSEDAPEKNAHRSADQYKRNDAPDPPQRTMLFLKPVVLLVAHLFAEPEAHAYSSSFIPAVSAACSRRCRSLSSAFCRIISADSVSITFLRRLPLVSVSLR